MKTFILFLALVFSMCGCQTVTMYVGAPSSLHDMGHNGELNNEYHIVDVSSRNEDNWETNVATIIYKVDDEVFSTMAIGVKKWFSIKSEWTYAEVGVGARLTETDDRNPWLADSNLLADVSIGVGITKDYQTWSFDLGYRFQHLSVPWRHDYGLNFDGVQFGVNIPF